MNAGKGLELDDAHSYGSREHSFSCRDCSNRNNGFNGPEKRGITVNFIVKEKSWSEYIT